MDFPPTFVINLKERTDRFEQIRKSFGRIWPVPIERIDAIRDSPGWKGCLKSHKKALEICKSRNLEFAIILEDDCELTKNGLAQFQELLPYLKESKDEWDVFLGGITFPENIQLKQENPPLFRIECQAAHFCMYNRRSIEKILNEFDENEVWDLFLKKHMRLWCTVPHIAIQRADTSNIENKYVNYTNHFKNSEAQLYSVSEGFLQPTSKFLLTNVLLLFFLTNIWFFYGRKRKH